MMSSLLSHSRLTSAAACAFCLLIAAGCGAVQKTVPRAAASSAPRVYAKGRVTAPITVRAPQKSRTEQETRTEQTRGGEGLTGSRAVKAARIGTIREANQFFGLSRNQLIFLAVLYGVLIGVILFLIWLNYSAVRPSVLRDALQIFKT